MFPPWREGADPASPPPLAPLPPHDRVGFATVGLGRLSLEQILPAFARSTLARPTALVSGSPDKRTTVARQYGIPEDRCFGYDDIERLRDIPDVQVVYVVTPNALHRRHVEAAARAGKHVLCEKPMATSSVDAEAMIAACEAAGVRLMIAYRIHYEPHHRWVAEHARSGRWGRLIGMTAINTQTVNAVTGPDQWRHKAALSGGGSLPDIGLYCLNTARMMAGEEPVEVFAWAYSPPGDTRFADVEATMSFTLRFASGLLVNAFTSYSARDDKHQRLDFERATIDMPRAYSYAGQRLLIHENDETGEDLVSEVILPAVDQFAAELDHFAASVRDGAAPRTGGDEGLRDQRIMEALYESARTGRPVRLM